MCYSASSSLRTSLFSALSIVYLLSSGIPHYQYLGVLLIGWCGMQFAEYLLWSTNPAKGCTPMNKLITLTLIPLVLVSQPLGSLLGSLLIQPWKESTLQRKQFIVGYSALVTLAIAYFTYYKRYKSCTIVTNQYHLHWHTCKYIPKDRSYEYYVLWFATIVLPVFMYWDKSWVFMALLFITPLYGYIYGWFSDSKASLWCYYTSYTSLVAAAALAAYQLGFGDALNATLK